MVDFVCTKISVFLPKNIIFFDSDISMQVVCYWPLLSSHFRISTETQTGVFQMNVPRDFGLYSLYSEHHWLVPEMNVLLIEIILLFLGSV